MRITFLLEVADQLWGGVKVALEDANWLSRRGHEVTVVSRSGPPSWMQLACRFQQVPDFRPDHLPDADALIATFWTTVPWAASAGPAKGVPVHFCQGYEGDNPEHVAVRDRIEAAYRLPGMHHVTIAPHLTALLRERFGITAHELRYAIDHDVHFPAEPPREPAQPLRVGLVGPYAVSWKDLPTGYAACRLAHEAGQKLVLVRASNTAPNPEERDVPFEVEWHQQLPPDRMGDFYRSLDVFLGTSRGKEEGFFLPAIEAMACGVPTVLTDIPCFRNHQRLVDHDRYALFVEPKDPAAMAEALVLAGALPDVRATLRTSGLEVASQYHIDVHGAQFEAVLQQLTADATSTIGPVLEPAANGRMRPEPHAGELRLVSKQIPQPDATGGTDGTAAEFDRTPRGTLAALRQELYRAAERSRDNGDHGDAARLFEATLCLSRGDDTTLLQEAGDCWLAAGDARRALDTFDRRLAAGGDGEAAHTGRGNALHALGRMQDAAQAFRAALAVGARTPDNYNRLGVVLFQAGDLVAARQSFERALVLDPQHQDALANLRALPAA